MQFQITYEIAEWQLRLCAGSETVCDELLPSFSVFKVTSSALPLLTTMTLDATLGEMPDSVNARVCETGNGDILVDALIDDDGQKTGYQFKIKDIVGEVCALMHSNNDFTQCRCKVYGELHRQQFGLNNAMMMAYAFAGATHGTLLVHASVVRHDGKGYAFVAKSGTGKSTQTQNWLKVIPRCDLMNDDNPVVRGIDGEAWIYGSPWSGKTPCYRQIKAPLAAISKIVRDGENHVERISPIIGFSELLASCSVMKWDKVTYHGICDTVTSVIECTPIYNLYCTADPISAQVCYETIGPNS